MERRREERHVQGLERSGDREGGRGLEISGVGQGQGRDAGRGVDVGR